MNKMIKKFLFLIVLLSPISAFALIEVDITRGNLNPLPVAVSPLSIDDNSKKSFQKALKKENLGSEISKIIENNLLIFTMNFYLKHYQLKYCMKTTLKKSINNQNYQ